MKIKKNDHSYSFPNSKQTGNIDFCLQTDFPSPIHQYGCYFMCLCFLLYQQSNQLSPRIDSSFPLKRQIIEFFNHCCENQFLRSKDCYVLTPCAILGIPEKISYRDRNYTCGDQQKEILCFQKTIPVSHHNKRQKIMHHFLVGQGIKYSWKNALEHIVYNPDPTINLNEWVLNSKRVFSFSSSEK